MAQPPVRRLLSHIRGLVHPPGTGPTADAALLHQFVEHQDEAAFAGLLDRHRALVWGVCYRVLGHVADAEDAFQATFLVLARKARVVRTESLPGWLHGVAFRVASKLRSMNTARRHRESRAEPGAAVNHPDELTWREVRQVLDDELARLPDKYRLPLLLCYLGGKTQDAAARELGWAIGTFRGRLDRAREHLRKRLLRRDIGLPAALVAASVADSVSEAATPADLAANTVRAATGCATRKAAVAAPVAALVEGMLRAMLLTKIKLVAALVLSLAILGVGAGLIAQQATAQKEPANEQAAPPEPARSSTKERTDLYGDPLPAGALARIGTLRFRHGGGNVVFTSDGKTLASAGAGARLWDFATGKATLEFTCDQGISQVALATDSKILAGIGSDNKVRLWAVDTGKEIGRLEGHTTPIASVAFAPDGKLLASGGQDGLVVWDVATRKEVIRKRFAPLPINGGGFIDRSSIMSVAFSPDGKTLAAGRGACGIVLWNVTTHKEICRLDEENDNDLVNCVAFSPDGKSLAAASGKAVDVWDLATAKKTSLFDWEKGNARLVNYSPDGRLLAASGGSPADDSNDAVVLWNVAARKRVRSLPGRKGNVSALSFSPDGKTLATTAEQAIRLWDVATGNEIRAAGPVSALWYLAIAPDSKTVATAEYRIGTLRLWDLETGTEIRRFGGETDGGSALAFSPDGKVLASGSSTEKFIQLWDPTTGREIRRLPTPREYIVFLAFALGGEALASKSYDEPVIRLWDVRTSKEIRQIPSPRGDKRSIEALAPLGKTLALASQGTIYLLDITTGKEIRQCQGEAAESVTWMAFSPDGKTLLSHNFKRADIFGDSYWSLWEVATGKEIRRLAKYQGADGLIAIAPGGRLLAVHNNGAIQLQDLATGRDVGRLKVPQVDWPGELAFAPDGQTLISQNGDTTALVWDVRRLAANRQPRALTGKDLQKCWADLAGADSGQAYQSMAALADAPEQAVPFLREQLAPPPGPDPKRLAQLIADLDSQQFAVRQQAAVELEKLGDVAETALRKALTDQPSLELRQRVEELLHKASVSMTPARLRELRSIQALEWMGTPAAKQLLQTVANSTDWPQRIREDAQGTLARLAKRAPSH